jgi:hypothetical protein
MKRFLKLRNVAKILVTCLAVTTVFSGCDPKENDPAVDDGQVTVTIKNLPAASASNGMGGMLGLYSTKPVQWDNDNDGHEDIPDIITSGSLMNGTARFVATGSQPGNVSVYSGGDGYLYLRTIYQLPVAGAEIMYGCFVGKNKVTLKPGDNVFDFTADFEILHQYAGDGILRITDVPREIVFGAGNGLTVPTGRPFNIMVYDYNRPTDEGDFDLSFALNTKPMAQTVFPTVDYLSVPLCAIINQRYNTTVSLWEYEPTENRTALNGYYFLKIETEAGYAYVGAVNFSNGNATVSYNSFHYYQSYND